ncbi:MAG: cupin domain-containing protein [Thermodesulfobacteriales bacterium]|nr:MAG: cupin domain-containing protein [Thermodesulfobacteriales bacterium]
MDKERTQIDHIISKLGEKIKYLRTEKSLSLKDLSERSGISAAAIHKIESNGIIPTITTMMKIADALGRDVNHFIEQAKEDKDVVFVSAKEREPILTFKKGLELNGISAKKYGDFIMTAAYAILEVGASSGKKPMKHKGEELVYCLQGKVEFQMKGETYILGPGDSLNFRTQLDHKWKNVGDKKAKLIWVLAVPPS